MELVLSWFIGDAFKTIFFTLRKAPGQFILCGLIQILVDFGVAYQMCIYPSGNGTEDPQRQASKGFSQHYSVSATKGQGKDDHDNMLNSLL